MQNSFCNPENAKFQRFPCSILANFMGVVYISNPVKSVISYQWAVISIRINS